MPVAYEEFTRVTEAEPPAAEAVTLTADPVSVVLKIKGGPVGDLADAETSFMLVMPDAATAGY